MIYFKYYAVALIFFLLCQFSYMARAEGYSVDIKQLNTQNPSVQSTCRNMYEICHISLSVFTNGRKEKTDIHFFYNENGLHFQFYALDQYLYVQRKPYFLMLKPVEAPVFEDIFVYVPSEAERSDAGEEAVFRPPLQGFAELRVTIEKL